MTNPPPPPPPGPPPPPPGPGPWTGYGYGQVPNSREHPDGTTVLVLGILGLVVCAVLAPIAWVKGNSALREMDAQPQVTWTNRGAVTAGRICGIIGTVLIAIGIAVVVLVLIVAAAAGSR